MPVPQAAFDHMFPSGPELPNLKTLRLVSTQAIGCPHCVEAAQVARIAASCPALQGLQLQKVTPGAFDTSCLPQD